MTYTATWEEIKGHYRVKDRDFPMLEDDMPTFMGIPRARPDGRPDSEPPEHRRARLTP